MIARVCVLAVLCAALVAARTDRQDFGGRLGASTGYNPREIFAEFDTTSFLNQVILAFFLSSFLYAVIMSSECIHCRSTLTMFICVYRHRLRTRRRRGTPRPTDL